MFKYVVHNGIEISILKLVLFKRLFQVVVVYLLRIVAVGYKLVLTTVFKVAKGTGTSHRVT
jgi:hypothetical protein